MKLKKFYFKLYKKILSVLDKLLVKYRVKKLNNYDFTIISNNCWAGYVYRRYSLPYKTPTVGLYFYAKDYIRFCNNLKYYIDLPLIFISYKDSKYKTELENKKQTNVPIAKLDDIEIIFLHYRSEKEAKEKWERRKQRINYDNLIFKFSKMNLCSEKELFAFDSINTNKKFCFIPPKDKDLIKSGIVFNRIYGYNEISDDTTAYSRFSDIETLINSPTVCGNKMF